MRGNFSRSLFILILVGIGLACISSCASQGESLFKSKGCINCHRFNGQGGNMGPDLTGVTSRRSDEWIAQQIRDATKNNPDSRMPAFPDISTVDIRSLLAYLKQGR